MKWIDILEPWHTSINTLIYIFFLQWIFGRFWKLISLKWTHFCQKTGLSSGTSSLFETFLQRWRKRQWVNSSSHPAGSGSLEDVGCYRLAYMGTEGSRYLYIYIYIYPVHIWSYDHICIHILCVYRYYGYTVFIMLNNPPSKYNHVLQSLATCPSILSISRSYLLTTTGVFPCHPMSLCLCTVLRACICSRACISSRACCKYCQDCSLEKPWESVMALRMGPQRSPHHYSKWL